MSGIQPQADGIAKTTAHKRRSDSWRCVRTGRTTYHTFIKRAMRRLRRRSGKRYLEDGITKNRYMGWEL